MPLRVAISVLLLSLSLCAAACNGARTAGAPAAATLVGEGSTRLALADARSPEAFLDRAERWLASLQKDVPGALRASADRTSPTTLSVRFDLKNTALADSLTAYAAVPSCPVRLDVEARAEEADLVLLTRLYDERADTSDPFPLAFPREDGDLLRLIARVIARQPDPAAQR